MRDGVRRITQIIEVVGMEGDVITTQDLFPISSRARTPTASCSGTFQPSGIRPAFMPRAEYYGLERTLLEAL